MDKISQRTSRVYRDDIIKIIISEHSKILMQIKMPEIFQSIGECKRQVYSESFWVWGYEVWSDLAL
tara:strand:+ start:228 stop:425 length:198 start_codon:yes stop_codon:yes gene_type:complete